MLRIHLFDRFRLFEGDRAVQFSAPPKTLPLLAYLLLHRAGPIPRDRLAFTLWPDVAENAARGNLRRHLHELRRALPPAPAGRFWFLADGAGVQWNPEADFWLDVAAFEEGSCGPDTLAAAVELVEGDLLPDIYEDWVFFDRERLRDAWLVSAGRLVSQCRERGHLADAMRYARLILQRDPLREETLRELIALRYETGDRTGAIQEYQRFEQRLREELGVAPMPETIELFERLRDEGGKLKAGADRAEASAVRLPSPASPRHNLPAQLTSFVGREEELDDLQRLLASPESGVRLLTLTGPGGTGKTRLALEAAARLLRDAPDRFPDGVTFIALSEVADPSLVAQAIGQTLGLAESAGRSPAEGLQTLLRSRHLLLILDNFEQVADAAPLVAELLAAAPGLRVMVTSRAVLRLYGEHEYPVPPLGLPDLTGLGDLPFGELAQYPAVALFVERSRAVRPDFVLTEANAAAVAEICVRLDGLPLAIELAAARSKLFLPQALLARLGSRLAFLGGAERVLTRGLSARQQTLRGTIDWSFQLLAGEEKRLFARLGVFAGEFGFEAADAIATDEGRGLLPSSLEDALASLVDKNMLRHETDAAGEPRFRMLLTLREYALERLVESDEVEAVRERHARYYLALAEQAAPELTGARQASQLRQLLSAQDNLRAALEWCQQTPASAELGLRLAIALGDFWYRRGEFSEGRRWLQGALDASPAAPAPLRAGALNHLGALARDLGDYPAARAALQESETLWRSLGDAGRRGLAWLLRHLGSLTYHQEDLDQAEEYQSASLALQRELGDRLGIAAALNGLAAIAYSRGRYAAAIARCEESLPLARAAGDWQLVGDVLNNLGIAAQAQGDYATARARLDEALAAYRELGDKYGQAIALNNLSNAARPQGDLAAARAYAEESVALYREVGNRAKSARPLFHLGAAALLQGDLAAASACLAESLEIHVERGFQDGVLEAIQGFAWLALAQDRPEPAARLLAAASALRQALGAPLLTVAARAEKERLQAAVEAALAPDHLAAAWQAGRALSLDEAVALALGRGPPP